MPRYYIRGARYRASDTDRGAVDTEGARSEKAEKRNFGEKNIPSKEKASIVMEAVEDALAIDPVLLDLTDKVLLFDYVLVCAGNSDTHVRPSRTPYWSASTTRTSRRPASPAGDRRVGADGLRRRCPARAERGSAGAVQLETFWSTEQPKGALPPMPTDDGVYAGATITDAGFDESEDDLDETRRGRRLTDEELDALDIDDEDPDDISFFNTADKEVEPIDEPDDLADDHEDGEAKPATKGDT
jgi:hypothetical protein